MNNRELQFFYILVFSTLSLILFASCDKKDVLETATTFRDITKPEDELYVSPAVKETVYKMLVEAKNSETKMNILLDYLEESNLANTTFFRGAKKAVILSEKNTGELTLYELLDVSTDPDVRDFLNYLERHE